MTTVLRAVLVRCAGALALPALILPADAFIGTMRPAPNVTPLGIIDDADVNRGNMRGAGCAWMDGPDGSIRFVSSGDRALVKVDGAVRILHPARGASDAFPFTFDRWVGDGMTVTVTRYGRARDRAESIIRPAVLTGTLAGRSFRIEGLLDCGT